MPIRVAEWLTGYLRVRVLGDPGKRVMSALVERRAQMWDVRPEEQDQYSFSLTLRDTPFLLACARRQNSKLQFRTKRGLPFWVWRARRRKVFLAGAAGFLIALYVLSSFVWHVEIEGTDQPQAVAAVLQKLHVSPGSMLYKILDQDSLQLALLDQLPELSWAGVRISGTAVYVHVIQRVKPSDVIQRTPQSIVARVPGVIENVLADSGLPLVKPGQFVTPGTVLISGVLSDGKTVYAEGAVQAVVWYRSQVVLPEQVQVAMISGDMVHHYYLVVGNWPLQVWGFSRPPYPQVQIQSVDTPLRLGDVTLPFTWRTETVYRALTVGAKKSEAELTAQGLHLAANDVLRIADDNASVLKQTILQKKLEHGKLYMSVWTEVAENIALAQKIAAK